MTLPAKVPFAVAYWPLTEASGSRLDEVGINTLTDNNTVGQGVGKFTNAADFESANSEYFSISDNAVLSMGDITMMLRVWVNFESIGADRWIIDKWTTVGNREYRLYYEHASTQFVWEVRDTGNTTTTTVKAGSSITTGVWYLLHARHDHTANEIGLAVNAGTEVTAATSGGIRDGAAQFTIGGRSGVGDYFDGLICDALVMKGAYLDATERTADYNGGTGVSFSNWRSLADAVAFAEAHWPMDEASGTRADAIGSLDLSDNNTVGSAAGMFDNAADFEVGNSEWLSCADDPILRPDTTTLWRFWCKPESLATSSLTPLAKRGTIEEWAVTIEDISGYKFFLSLRDAASTTNLLLGATNFGNLTAGTWYLVHAWHDVENKIAGISVNGVVNRQSWTGGGVSAANTFRVGAKTDSTAHFDGLIDDVVILKGYILSSAERAADYNSGTGIAFEDWDGGGDIIMSVDPGSYAVTGTDASLEQGYEVAADAGSYSIIGQDATLLETEVLVCDAGSYAISGTDASLLKAKTITIEAGSYAVTGTDASLEQGYEVTCDVGIYSLSGQDATFTVNATISVDFGVYAMTGTVASLEWNHSLSAETGSYVITGTDVTLTAEEAAILGGKFTAGQVYHPGFQNAQLAFPAFHAADVFHPGFTAGQVNN